MPMRVPVQLSAVCAVSDDIAYVAGFPDALAPHQRFTRLFAFNATTSEQWFHHDWPGQQVVSVCLKRAGEEGPRAVCALSEDGQVEIFNSGQRSVEVINGAGFGEGTRDLGPLRAIREVGGQLFACGSTNQVYRRSRAWAAIDQAPVASALATMNAIVARAKGAASVPADDDTLLALTQQARVLGNLEDIDGSSAQDVYACGMGGALWHWDGVHWVRMPVPSDEHLHSLHAVSADAVWVAGHNGTVLHGSRAAGFKNQMGHDVNDHLWCIRAFEGETYVGTAKGLFTCESGGLQQVKTPHGISGLPDRVKVEVDAAYQNARP